MSSWNLSQLLSYSLGQICFKLCLLDRQLPSFESQASHELSYRPALIVGQASGISGSKEG